MRSVISTLTQLRDGTFGHRYRADLVYPIGVKRQPAWIERWLRIIRLYPSHEMDAHRARLGAYVSANSEAGETALKLLNENEHLRARLAVATGTDELLGYFAPRNEYDKACRERDQMRRERDWRTDLWTK